ncbi:hypothetical protein GCM10010218_48250 [Streptomyces mashuensis]|uniref:Uncharacterized protein n=1 Tax=Streptomyces mashuensis TaxID=33904 RepID=A0A919B5V2_9ACTN|nr:hypothetical protein GCM10010218_48250 [Streptomyces mashuensis]
MLLAAAVVAVLCVAGYVLAGEIAVLAVVVAGVTGLMWSVAAASRPRPRVRRRRAGRASGVRIGHQRDAHVVRDEGRQGEGVEDFVEPEPPR